MAHFSDLVGAFKDADYCPADPRDARIAELESEVARLRRIIDSRPAINAGLPQTYIEWSQSIYQIEVNKAMNANN